jgi:hypothetical protein
MKQRRREPRRKEENQVILFPASGEEWPGGQKSLTALTQDISTGGLCLLCDTRLPILAPIKIRLVLSRTRKVLNLEGCIRWINPVYEDELFEVGIEFQDIPPPKALLLLKHIYGDTRSFESD